MICPMVGSIRLPRRICTEIEIKGKLLARLAHLRLGHTPPVLWVFF